MDLRTSPRHSRRGFIQKAGNLATALSNSNCRDEIIDFSPERASCAPERSESRKLSISEERDDTAFFSFLAAEISSLAGGGAILDCRPESQRASQSFLPVNTNSTSKPFEPSSSSYRLNVHTEAMPDGTRIETFDNGSIVNKDALGRVVEIFSGFAECLYFSYDKFGELGSFTRTNARGSIHSTGKKGQHGVTVRDCRGRVKAAGECMTVDPWGRFYLHTSDGQFFCLDLVAGIHYERRRLVKPDGRINFVTAAFAHDGFRMATVYARSGRVEARRRQMIYRFYGRDGTVVEFGSEDEFRDLNPARSMPPGTFPVHESWMRSRQAHTAWESVKEYLCREVVQALAP